ncbi:MAG: hypothetical protein GF311_01045 [Candidatus Lokiarchaeota archaeon]|nr:hypothetical protein [Candidatus Lokiarchaeota archaeon]
MGDKEHSQQQRKLQSHATSGQPNKYTGYTYPIGLLLFVLCGIILTIFAMVLL